MYFNSFHVFAPHLPVCHACSSLPGRRCPRVPCVCFKISVSSSGAFFCPSISARVYLTCVCMVQDGIGSSCGYRQASDEHKTPQPPCNRQKVTDQHSGQLLCLGRATLYFCGTAKPFLIVKQPTFEPPLLF